MLSLIVLIMKTKILTVTAIAAALLINAVHAGSVSLGYGTDSFSKGSILADEHLSASVSYSQDVGALSVEGSASAVDELSDGQSIYTFSGGVSSSLGDLLNAYVGLEHEEIVSGASQLDAVLELSLNSILNPSFLVQRDTSEDNYVLELGVSHSFDLSFANLELSGAVGNADRYGIEDNDYHRIGVELSKSLSETVSGNLSYDRVDSDSIDSADVISAGLTFSF